MATHSSQHQQVLPSLTSSYPLGHCHTNRNVGPSFSDELWDEERIYCIKKSQTLLRHRLILEMEVGFVSDNIMNHGLSNVGKQCPRAKCDPQKGGKLLPPNERKQIIINK
jgi:hypothetical protein